jgi:hypothetical protein
MRELDIKPIDRNSLDRLEIVRFALIILHFEESGDNLYTQTIIETIAQLARVKPLNISYVREQIKYKEKPKAHELGLLNHFFGVPYRTLCRYGKVASKTIIKELEKYVLEEYQQPLINNINKEITDEIIQFNKVYKKLFKNATYLTKTEVKR